jgi:2-keto-3-deoxy-L-rhamnonate aldolase RhmA
MSSGKPLQAIEEFKKKLSGNQLIIGTTVTLTDSSVTELLSWSGFDFLWIDTEHTAIEKKDLLQHLIAAEGTGTATLVRIPWNDPVLVKPILDMGPSGVIFPMIRSVEEAKQAIASCLYPPRGIRGFAPIRAAQYGGYNAIDYIKDHDQKILKMIQIEHIDAVNCLEDIVKVEGIDALIVGPMDLTGSLGKLGQLRDPEVLRVMDRIGEIVSKTDIPLGIAFGYDHQTVQEWVGRGIKFLCINGDIGFIQSGAKELLRDFKERFQS